MKALFKKEIYSYFSSPIAYLVIGFFLIINGLFLFVFNDTFNILNTGFADIQSFFYLSPWVFLLLIPALTMKSFSEEFNSGTIELLQTLPISNWQIVFSKFLASFSLVFFAIILTFFYIITVYQLGNPVGNIDIGSTIGSYLGLLFLASTYVSIGLFTSTFSKNQIVAFILSVVISFALFYGLDGVNATTIFGFKLEKLGLNAHYKSILRGVIDSRDLLYFVSITTLFLFMTKQKLDHE